ncbi:dihydrofolate reductase [Sediminibacillus dalangtanensis]|uniref:Dihydrofolate reductase n=1 Tax=Sediminibacillus dalangtanensis TaxID=2729421 RepID=A0ABX7VUE2_9BACI|nr:dihydrofolate reductase family protein [Sediminibacillus dalangtanensis]QTN00307.1 dihydrofolate reductase [Sediminibacillus dalangtanensis]
MRKIIVTEFLTLDGVMEDPGGGDESEYGGWSAQFWSKEAEEFKHDELFASDALLLGRVTYQGFAAAWPAMTDDTGFAERMNNVPKYVVSTTLEEVEWNNSRLIKGNLAEEISKLKQEPGQDITVHGSGQLVNSLMQYDLIDEYRLMIHPVVVGGGKRLFKENSHAKNLSLVETHTFKSGIVVLIYKSV